MREVMAEARAFLSLPQPEPSEAAPTYRQPSPPGSAEAARRLFAISRPICGTLAEIYLRYRGLDPAIVDISALRFHPSCYYREDGVPKRTFPALIAAATDEAGRLTGVHRTWLDPAAPGEKAPVSSPRRAMGDLLGSGGRFGTATALEPPVLIAGEGLETVMSLRMTMPRTGHTQGVA